MRKLILIIGFGALTLFGILGAVWGSMAASNPQAGLGVGLQIAKIVQTPYFVPGILIFVFIMMGAAFSPLITGAMKNAQKKKRLMQIGQKATAKIVSVRDTGITVNNNPYVEITVEIKPGVQATFSTMIARYAAIRIGDSIEVLYDPSNPSDAIAV